MAEGDYWSFQWILFVLSMIFMTVCILGLFSICRELTKNPIVIEQTKQDETNNCSERATENFDIVKEKTTQAKSGS